MTTLLVDWLGRGGIAQTSEAWVRELRACGEDVVVATRANRELRADIAPTRRSHALLEHRALAQAAANAIRDRKPELVIVQNYVVAALEAPVYAAAAAVGARLAVVVHDHKLHTVAAGTSRGLHRLLDCADVVFAHTRYVARHLRRDATVIDHPLHLGVLDFATGTVPREWRALHFGVVRRRYKGGDTVARLHDAGVPGWDLRTVGGDGYVETADLVAEIEASSATLLPYRMATQSGAVVLAQALGSVPIVSAVGGIPEQVINGVTGILMPPGAPVACWQHALERLRDDSTRAAMAAAGRAAVTAAHDRFAHAVAGLVGARV